MRVLRRFFKAGDLGASTRAMHAGRQHHQGFDMEKDRVPGVFRPVCG
jgi:hypothetical protein